MSAVYENDKTIMDGSDEVVDVVALEDGQVSFRFDELGNILIGSKTYGAETGLRLPIYTDLTRPLAGNAGAVIFNSDSGLMNIDNGTDWTTPDGTVL